MAVPTPSPRLFLALLLGLAVSCEDKSADTDTNDTSACSDLSANAGPDQSVTVGSDVTLDGEGSVVCLTDSRTFTWEFDAVPVDSAVDESALSDNKSSTASVATFTPDVPGDYVLSLVVSDGDVNSAPDLVVITVTSEDQPPVALCGENQSGQVGERVTMDGSSSYDPESLPITDWSWSMSSVPTCSSLTSDSLYDRAESIAGLIPDCDGIYVVSLVVSDGTQWSEPDLCYIDVATDNKIPVADAGDSAELPPCNGAEIQLDGYGSYDEDGDTLTWSWSLLSAPAGSAASDADFNDPTLPDAVFTLPDDPQVAGEYSFELQVYDGKDWSAPDLVKYTVVGEALNSTPIANAGDDQTISSEAECSSASYVWTCGECDGGTAIVDGSASYDPDDDEIAFFWKDPSGTATFAIPKAPMTRVTVPGGPAEYGVDTTTEYEITLEVSDGCEAVGTDTVVVSFVCTGEAI